MPLRRKDNQVSRHVTLSEALNWIAFDSFGGPEPTSAEVEIAMFGESANVEEIEVAEFQRKQSMDVAENDFFAALRDGDIGASGFLATQIWDDGAGFNYYRDWWEQKYIGHASERTSISAQFWRREGVKWDKNLARSPDREYADIMLEREEVLRVWPPEGANSRTESSTDEIRPKRTHGRGRPPLYQETEFLALCVCEASANDLPPKQADFVKTMSELLALVWGERQTPSETWLKERVKAIYECRSRYEQGRQLLVR